MNMPQAVCLSRQTRRVTGPAVQLVIFSVLSLVSRPSA